MTTSRAQEVAEVLWELKRAGKVAKLSTIATRAGFSAGQNGRSVQTALKTVRRDWPHLQWWRAIHDTGLMTADSEQSRLLEECGFEIAAADGDEEGSVTIAALEEHLMQWDDGKEETAAS